MQFGASPAMHPRVDTGQMESLQKGIAIADAALNNFNLDRHWGTRQYIDDLQVASAPIELPADLHSRQARLATEACIAPTPVTFVIKQALGSLNVDESICHAIISVWKLQSKLPSV